MSMSMSEDTENFEQLRRLFALKRYEQPPPGYFNNFSRQVILRIRAGERGEVTSVLDWFSWEAPWLQRVWGALETKPILAGAFGVGLCGLLVAGALYSDKSDVATGALAPTMDTASLPLAPMGLSEVDHPLLARPVGLRPANANLINATQTDDLLLNALQRLRAEPAGASVSFPGAN
jgi:hypothetical protein